MTNSQIKVEIQKSKTGFIGGVTVVLVVALAVRVIGLGKYPVSMGIDEIANAYNAYTLLTTGHDEWGKVLPVTLRSFNDYKPPVNIYLIVPSIAFFGKTEAAVRLPTAVLGALTAVVWAVWVRRWGMGRGVAIAAGLGLALSPWHINYSRATFEAVTALFLVVIGAALFQRWEKGGGKAWAAGAAAMLGLSMWTYHAERLFVPVLVIYLVLSTQYSVLKKARIFVAVLGVMVIPLMYLAMFTPAVGTRAAATSWLREKSLERILHRGNYGSIWERVWDNDSYLIYRHGLGKYLNYFDVRYWFWDGLQLTPAGYPDMGLLYLVELPVLALGVVALAQGKKRQLVPWIILWGLFGVLPASLTMNEQHGLRALLWWPAFGLILAAGYEYGWEKIKNRRWIAGIWAAGLVVNLGFGYHMYVNQSFRWLSEYWHYPYKDIATFACRMKDKYENVFVSEAFGEREQLTGAPQLYLAWYCGGRTDDYVGAIDRPGILVKRPYWPADKTGHKNSLFIAAPWDFGVDKLSEKEMVKKWYFLDGKLAFVAVETK